MAEEPVKKVFEGVKKGQYSIAMVGVTGIETNVVQRAIATLVQEMATADYANAILEYIGTPTFLTAGNQIIAIQAVLIHPDWEPPPPVKGHKLELVNKDKIVDIAAPVKDK